MIAALEPVLEQVTSFPASDLGSNPKELAPADRPARYIQLSYLKWLVSGFMPFSVPELEGEIGKSLSELTRAEAESILSVLFEEGS